MKPLPQERLQRIARARNVHYEPLPNDNPLIVATRMSREFPLARDTAFALFADPATHVRLFSIIKGSSTIPREPIAKMVPINQFYAVEHVEERDPTPRFMLVRYTLSPPDVILKEGVPDPFGDLDGLGDVGPLDKKKAKVMIRLEDAGENTFLLTTESAFVAETGEIFVRGLIDHVWLNFYENLMVELKEIRPDQIMTRP
ncbi:hypothetical protein [Mesorhizobium sp. M0478]|uniref:hypothetical protein n=1 Tax=Mesorhizobium sp. M0478 TaxID=2956947 RepID=UPI00333A9AE1